jgi:hypothetical protein
MAKKRGLPDDHALEANAEGVTEVADIGDFLDEFEPNVRKRPAADLTVMDGGRDGGGAKVATAPAREAPPAPEPARQRREESSPQPKRSPKKAEPTVVLAPRKRPPRKEMGFDPETLQMLGELHRDGMDQSSEESLTRSEVRERGDGEQVGRPSGPC